MIEEYLLSFYYYQLIDWLSIFYDYILSCFLFFEIDDEDWRTITLVIFAIASEGAE